MIALTLYEIAAEYRGMVESLMQHQEDAAAIKDTIEAEGWPLTIKAQNVAYAIRNLESLAAQIKDAEVQMAARRKSIEKRAEHVREYLKTAMEVAGVSRIDCPHFVLNIAKNPASVDVFEPSMIPAKFMRTPEPPPPAPDKKAIAQAIKDGEEVPGAMLAQGTSLRIK